MSLPSSMYMFLSPVGMYLMFGMGIKLIKKEPENVQHDLSARRVHCDTVRGGTVDRGKR